MRQPTIEIHGPKAAEVERDLQALFEVELGERAPRAATPAASDDHATRKADPVAVAGLVLAVPGALLATVDLAQRLQLKAKVERLLAWVRQRRSNDPTIEITLLTSDGRTLRLDAATVAEVLDAFAQAQASATDAEPTPPVPGS